jgi:hypothetical protein
LAQNTAAATVAAAPTTAEEINAVVKPLVDSAAGALEKAGMGFLEGAAGVVGFIFASSEQAGGGKELIFEHEQKEKQEEAAPAAAAGGAGKGVIPGHPFRGANAAQDAFKHLEQFHGISPTVASERLHNIKAAYGLGAADNVVIGRTGDVYNSQTGERLGSLTDKHW